MTGIDIVAIALSVIALLVSVIVLALRASK